MLKTGTQKLIEQAVARAFAELLKSLQGCCLVAGKPGVIRSGYLPGPGVVRRPGPGGGANSPAVPERCLNRWDAGGAQGSGQCRGERSVGQYHGPSATGLSTGISGRVHEAADSGRVSIPMG